MKTLLVVLLVFLLSCLFISFAFADICTDVEQDTGLDLNEAECYVLEQVEKGVVAQFKVSDNWDERKYQERFSKIENRTLRAVFLENLLTGTLPNLNVTDEGVRIDGAIVREAIAIELNLSTIPFAVSLTNCIFEKGVNFMGVLFAKAARFIDTTFSGGAIFDVAKFSGDAYFNWSTFSGEASFLGSTFSGEASFGMARFSGEASFGGSTFSGEASFGMARFSGEASFGGSTFSGRASFDQSTFYGKADFLGAKFSAFADFSRSNFFGETDFNGANFSGNSNFYETKFSGKTTFKESEFSKELIFNESELYGEIDFSNSHFKNIADFSGSSFFENSDFSGSEFSGEADFTLSSFHNWAVFTMTKYSGKAKFGGTDFKRLAKFDFSRFSGEADFELSYFNDWADFSSSEFFLRANFNGTSFLGATEFTSSIFLGTVVFSLVTFSEETHFLSCEFKSKSIFKNTLFENIVIFDDVTGFSNMQIEWKYDPDKFDKEKDEKKIQSRGLYDNFKYNQTFYIALIKNFRDMGWYTEADDCYYTYRVEKRKHRLENLLSQNQGGETNSSASSSWWSKFMLDLEWIFLDRTFGYGVKPLKLLKTYLFLWFLFIPIYVAFLRLQYQYGKRKWYVDLFHRVSRSAIHSIDTLTPGINLYAFTTLTPYYFETTGYKKTLLNVVVRFQQLSGWYLAALFLILFSRVWIR